MTKHFVTTTKTSKNRIYDAPQTGRDRRVWTDGEKRVNRDRRRGRNRYARRAGIRPDAPHVTMHEATPRPAANANGRGSRNGKGGTACATMRENAAPSDRKSTR